MALIKCNECGQNVSDKVTKCVHCGSKIISEEQRLKKEIKKQKRNKRRKIIKIFVLIIVILGSLIGIYLGLARLFPKKNINYIEKYKDYLDYALGDNWEVTESLTNCVFNGFWFEEITWWTIGYRDQNNEVQEINLENYNLTDYKDDDIVSDYYFAIMILDFYTQRLQEELNKGDITPLDDYIVLYNLGVKYKYEGTWFAETITDYIKVGSGLNFQDLTINKLNPGIYLMGLEVYYTSGNDIHNYTINHAKTLIEHYKIGNAIVGSGMSNKDSNGYQTGVLTHGYCLKNNQKISCPIETDIDSYREVFGKTNKYIKLK